MNTQTETLSVLAPTADPHTYAALCIGEDQPLNAAERLPLNHHEKQMLRDNELRIEQGLNSYYEIGRALRVIKRLVSSTEENSTHSTSIASSAGALAGTGATNTSTPALVRKKC